MAKKKNKFNLVHHITRFAIVLIIILMVATPVIYTGTMIWEYMQKDNPTQQQSAPQ